MKAKARVVLALAVAALSAVASTSASTSTNVDPIAVVDYATTFESVPVTIAVLDNDSDPDTDPLSATSATQGANGATVVNGDDTITYTPSAGFHGTDSFSYTIDDGAGGTASANVTVIVMEDAVPPTITAALSPSPNANGWYGVAAGGTITVTFTCSDAESGIASCPSPVEVSAEGQTPVSGNATDQAGNTASASATVKLDLTPPSVSLEAPDHGRPGESLTASAAPADALSGIDFVRFTVDGVNGTNRKTAPFTHAFDVPETAPPPASLAVEVLVSDRAGNTATDSDSVSVLAGGFVTGEVYDASQGVPLEGASVDYGAGTTASDARGRFGFTTPSAGGDVTVVLSKTGYLPVERSIAVDSLQGSRLLDARLTPEASQTTSIDGAGGTVTAADAAAVFELTVPAGALSDATAIRMTARAPHALRASLPLGWSPIASVAIGPEATAFSVPGDLELTTGGLTGLLVDLVRYDEAQSAWVVEASGLTGGASVSASAAIPSTGDYAFVLADTGATAPPAAVVGQALAGAEPVTIEFGLTATSEVTPETAPLGAAVAATADLVLFSPVALPSGTLVSARVEESFESASEGELRSEPFTQELPLHRFRRAPTGRSTEAFPSRPPTP